MIEIARKILYNVLASVYEPLGFAIILSVLFMFFYMFAKEHGWKQIVQLWIKAFKEEKQFRNTFFLSFYVALMMFRTLLNRYIWRNPLANVIGVWGMYNANGEFTTEVVENVVLFIPFTILLFWSFQEKMFKNGVKFFAVLWKSIWVVFSFSLVIEFLQLFLHLGTFQLSDLFYNTVGGFIGGFLYWTIYKIRFRKK